MPITVSAVEGAFAGLVEGAGLSRTIDDEDIARILDAFHRPAVLVLRRQGALDDDGSLYDEDDARARPWPSDRLPRIMR